MPAALLRDQRHGLRLGSPAGTHPAMGRHRGRCDLPGPCLEEVSRHTIDGVGHGQSWASNIPTAWPSDGLQSEKSSGEQQKKAYVDAGWQMLDVHATWADGGVGVEIGLVELYERMTTGRFKVFSHLADFFDEKMSYHRDENGKIVKLNDDILSAVRYA